VHHAPNVWFQAPSRCRQMMIVILSEPVSVPSLTVNMTSPFFWASRRRIVTVADMANCMPLGPISYLITSAARIGLWILCQHDADNNILRTDP
jgi:hypothetical protein